MKDGFLNEESPVLRNAERGFSCFARKDLPISASPDSDSFLLARNDGNALSLRATRSKGMRK